jgi:DNA processing protein
MDDLSYWVAFNRIPGLGRARFSLLEQHFGTLEQAWHASAAALKAAGLDQRTVQAIVERRPTISPQREMAELARHNVRALTWHDETYPHRLKEIYDPPPLLYLRGGLQARDDWAIAVVGTRRCTAYGRETAHQIVSDLARHGITIVSGLARGIDAVAHQAALEAEGRTIGVLAGGLDTVYPAEHLPLARRVLSAGALVSEHPLGVRPRAEYFPRRNRIMSGLSRGTLVVEAGEGSGALITADLALEQGRDIFAVPGSIFSPASQGTNRLIQEGAKLVLSARDILEELNMTMTVYQAPLPGLAPADATEAAILQRLSAEPTHIDLLRRQTGLPIAVVSSTLAMMELKGLARQVGAMSYIRAKEASASYTVTVQ